VTDHPTDRFTEVHDLVTAQLEGELTDEQATRLEQLVCDDAEARRLYVQHVEQSVSLRWWAGQPGGEVAPAQPPVAKLAPGASADSQEPQVVARVGRRTWLTPLRVAAVVALLVGIGYLLTTSTSIPRAEPWSTSGASVSRGTRTPRPPTPCTIPRRRRSRSAGSTTISRRQREKSSMRDFRKSWGNG